MSAKRKMMCNDIRKAAVGTSEIDPAVDAVFRSFFKLEHKECYDAWIKEHSHRWNCTELSESTTPLPGKRKFPKLNELSINVVNAEMKCSTGLQGNGKRKRFSLWTMDEPILQEKQEPFRFEQEPLEFNEVNKCNRVPSDEDIEVLSELLLPPDGAEDDEEEEDAIDEEERNRQLDRLLEQQGYDFSNSESDSSKKRSKWNNAELKSLWKGIEKHGNNWTAIRGSCLGRSYCQIKDKGRRCLFLLGWETGRSKQETESSAFHAKQIAKAVLARMK